MKKIVSILLALIMVISCFSFVTMAAEDVKVIFDGELLSFDVPAQIINGRTMVPVRKIFEKLGMVVEWNGDTQKVISNKKGVFLELPINSTTVYRNTVEQEIDVPAQIINGRTLVPVRVVSEYAGADVEWDSDTQTVYITPNNDIKNIYWNDIYDYYGQADGNTAVGYGGLYDKENGKLIQLGKYIDSEIIVGTFYFDNGETFVGNFENGYPVYGTYNYSDGATFSGEFKDSQPYDGLMCYSSGDSYVGKLSNGTRNGYGQYTYADGSFHQGEWKNGQPNGKGLFYDAVEDVQYEGNYIDGKRDGDFVIKDFFLDKTYYATYDNGVYINEERKKLEEKQKKLDEIYKKIEALDEEYKELNKWYENEMSELYEYVSNGNPYETEWAEEIREDIYNQYGISSGSSPADSNLDSFAAANAMRQQAALKAKADSMIAAMIADYNQTYIEERKTLINNTYNSQKKSLDAMKNSLTLELQILKETY